MENLVSLPSLRNIYQNRKVFLTGHTGFKGAWLMACLHLAGASTKGYALPSEYPGGLFELLQPLEIIDSVIGDVRDKSFLKKEIESFQPDYIFHLAAQPIVRRSYEIPAETFEVNVTGTANLLEIVKNLPGKCTVIVITTDKVYENKELDILYKEEDVLGGYDPYSASKASAELLVNSFRNSFFNPEEYSVHKKAIATVRAGNVIGGGDWSKDRIIPDMVKSLKEKKNIEVRNPSAVRPWQHVLEPIGGYLLLGGKMNKEPLNYFKAYNFGPLPEDHLPVKDLVEIAIKSWGNGNWVDSSDKNQPHEAGILKLDISRAIKDLQWNPKMNSTQAIEWTIQWYKNPIEIQASYTFKQIIEYLNL